MEDLDNQIKRADMEIKILKYKVHGLRRTVLINWTT